MYYENTSKLKWISVLFFFCFISNAQLAVIYDKDGYVNVRETANVKSKIIDKIIEGQVFCINTFEDSNPKNEWLKVWLSTNPDSKIKDFVKYKNINEEGYIHKSRILYLEDLKQISLVNQSPYKSFFKNGELEIDVEIKPFDKTKHLISKIKGGGYKIDGKSDFWAISNSIPKNEFKTIKIVQNNSSYIFPKEALVSLYDLNVEVISLFRGKNGELYLNISGGDGSDSYEIIWFLKNGRIFSMTVMQTIP